MLLADVTERLRGYEAEGLHYHLAATGIYAARGRIGDPLAAAYRPFLVAGLIAYDMARQLGGAPYRHFADRLGRKLDALRPTLAPLLTPTLANADFDACGPDIATAYAALAAAGAGGLHAGGHRFFVGASKVLHWLNPELFLVLDRHIARAFARHPDPASRVRLFRAGAPCYSPDAFLQCLRLAQREICAYGEARLRRDGGGQPLATIYGNVAFQSAQ